MVYTKYKHILRKINWFRKQFLFCDIILFVVRWMHAITIQKKTWWFLFNSAHLNEFVLLLTVPTPVNQKYNERIIVNVPKIHQIFSTNSLLTKRLQKLYFFLGGIFYMNTLHLACVWYTTILPIFAKMVITFWHFVFIDNDV